MAEESASTRKHRITIKDVGRAAGVSVATVSKALNGTGMLTDETIQRVIDAADRLGYRPNRAAQGLVGGRSFQVGYGLPQLGTWGILTLNAFLHALVAAGSGHGLEVVLFRGETSDIGGYEDFIRRGKVDGFVLSDTNYQDHRVDYLLSRGFPFVAFGRTARQDEHFWVDVDGAAGTRAVTLHLLEQGHERFAIIGWPEGSESGDLRIEGVQSTLQLHGLAPASIFRTVNGIEQGRRAMAQILESEPGVTAVIAVDDDLALGAISEAQRRGIEVGPEMAISGFDDLPSAEVVTPTLTSIRQPFERVGSVLVGMLGEVLAGTATNPRGVFLEPTLVVRDSTRRSR